MQDSVVSMQRSLGLSLETDMVQATLGMETKQAQIEALINKEEEEPRCWGSHLCLQLRPGGTWDH